MTTNPTQFNFNSTYGGLGSNGSVTQSFTVSAQTIGTGSYYSHPIQYFDVGASDFICKIQYNFGGLETVWRSGGGLTFGTSNQFLFSGGSLSVAGVTKFELELYTVYLGNSVGIILGLYDRSLSGASISTPAITCSMKIHTFNLAGQ